MANAELRGGSAFWPPKLHDAARLGECGNFWNMLLARALTPRFQTPNPKGTLQAAWGAAQMPKPVLGHA